MSTESKVQRLYAVNMVVTAVVVATSEIDAERVFRAHKSAIISDGDYDPECDYEVKQGSPLPHGWKEDCLPYGNLVDQTIGQWLDLAPPEVVRDTKTIDMFVEVAP
ncbi:hypothetical protein [Massilia sp. CCM 8734]|uniref:hypothetical protein n=1 Tax=Massilia sp. CCM 8734 TaxID=2609283 RepID=UPI001423C2DB|nr:hypothetical protein [Massilia sp. CCM 8734]NHZ94584.1 hypothetical protein [Massilia sp. CCM 8734]